MNEKLRSNMTVPNLLSLLRLIMIPAIIITYIKGYFIAALVLLAVSGITDTLDGTIARKFNQISSLGKLLDPLADKLTVLAVVICLTIRHSQMWLLLGILIVKEGLMLTGAYILLKKGTRPSESKIWGKVATFLLYVVMALIIFSDVISVIGVGVAVPPVILWVLAVAAALCMILALMQYIPIFYGILSGKYNIESERFEDKNNDAPADEKAGHAK